MFVCLCHKPVLIKTAQRIHAYFLAQKQFSACLELCSNVQQNSDTCIYEIRVFPPWKSVTHSNLGTKFHNGTSTVTDVVNFPPPMRRNMTRSSRRVSAVWTWHYFDCTCNFMSVPKLVPDPAGTNTKQLLICTYPYLLCSWTG